MPRFLSLLILLSLMACSRHMPDGRLSSLEQLAESDPKAAYDSLAKIPDKSLSEEDRHYRDFLSVKISDKAYMTAEQISNRLEQCCKDWITLFFFNITVASGPVIALGSINDDPFNKTVLLIAFIIGGVSALIFIGRGIAVACGAKAHRDDKALKALAFLLFSYCCILTGIIWQQNGNDGMDMIWFGLICIPIDFLSCFVKPKAASAA